MKVRNGNEVFIYNDAYLNNAGNSINLITIPYKNKAILDFNNTYYVLDDTVVNNGKADIKLIIYNYLSQKSHFVHLNKTVKCKDGQAMGKTCILTVIFPVDPAHIYLGFNDFDNKQFDLYDYNVSTGMNNIIYSANEITFPLYSEANNFIVALKKNSFQKVGINSEKYPEVRLANIDYFFSGFVRKDKLILYRIEKIKNVSDKVKPRQYIELTDINGNSSPLKFEMPDYIKELCLNMDVNPDGSKIVFSNEINGGLYVYDLNNKNIRQITYPGLFYKMVKKND
ncbi:MAG: hypothetical protein LWY06_17955 [Firmicutes bacterium]|nr:hypothetical protein [Bacillota bacterium]